MGRCSGYSDRHLLVAPSREDSNIRPSGEYSSVVVASCKWPVSTYLVGIENYEEVVTQNVREFAEALKQLAAGEQSAEQSVWPQEVHVCALCEKITREG